MAAATFERQLGARFPPPCVLFAFLVDRTLPVQPPGAGKRTWQPNASATIEHLRSSTMTQVDDNSIKRHAQLTELFLAVCELDPAARQQALAGSCPNDPQLQREIEELLLQDEAMLSAEPIGEPPPAVGNGFPTIRAADSTFDALSPPYFVGNDADSLLSDEQVIAGYRLEARIGRGGMGVVYKATQLNLNRTVALKVLPSAAGTLQPELIERFQREARAAGALRHPNIVPIHDFGVSAVGHYYAMEWIDGPSLDHVVAALREKLDGPREPAASDPVPTPVVTSRPIPLLPNELPFSAAYFERVVAWMLDACAALTAAHAAGVIHRDIKPGNLLISSDGRLRVADFGLVDVETNASLTVQHGVVGTLRYLSPEQLFGRRVPLDPRADLYALGATFYELLTLRPLFGDRSAESLVASVIAEEAPLASAANPKAPRELSAICGKLLQKMPADRYASAEEASADLRAARAGRPISAHQQGAAMRGLRKIRRLRVPLGVAILLGIVALITAQMFGSWRETDREATEEFLRVGLLAQQEQRWNDAETNYRLALEHDERNVRALGNLAIVLKERFNAETPQSSEMLDEAAELLDIALDAQPHHGGLWNVLGVVQKKRGQLESAIVAYENALSVPDASSAARIAALNNLGELYWMLGEPDEGARYIREAAREADETNTAAWYAWCDLAALELYLGEPNAELSIARAFDEKAEPGWRMHLVRARIRLELPRAYDPEAAFRDALAAQERSTADWRIERTLAIAALRTDRFEEAMEFADSAISLGDDSEIPRLVIGIAHAYQGDRESAERALGAALDRAAERGGGNGYNVATERGLFWIVADDATDALMDELRSLIGE